MKYPCNLVLALAFLTPVAASQGTPTIGAAVPLAGDLGLGPAGGVQQFPAIAAGANAHLAAWADHRSGFEDLTTGVGCRDVYAQLLGSDGTPLSPLPLRVAGGLGRKRDVQVAWNGTHWLVTFRTDVPSSTFAAKAAALLGVRVDAQGNVLDPTPIVIRSYTWSSTFAYALGSNGDTWAAVIQGASGSGGEASVEGWLVQPDGTPQLASSSLFPTTSLLLKFRLCWSGTQYLLTYDDSGTRGRRLTGTLGLLGSQLIVSAAGTSDASSAPSGSGFLVAFADSSSLGSAIMYRSVSSTGALGPITNVTPTGILPNNQPRLAWNGNGHTLTWWQGYYEPSTLRYARIDAAGSLLDLGGIEFGHGVAPSWPDISSLGDGNAQVIWVDKVTTPPNVGDVFGTRITSAGVDAPTTVAASTPRQGFADLTAGPNGYMAVYTSERAGSVAILAQRVDASGLALDPEPIELGSRATFGHPGVAWNGQHYLVVWHDLVVPSFVTDDVVLARRVAADGTPIDPAPFQVLQGADPSVAAAGSTFLVAARFAETTQIFHIRGVRVDSAGNVLDTPALTIGGNFARWPSVASFGDRWLVAWQRNPTHDNPSASAHARVVFANGSQSSSWSLGSGGRPSAAASPTVGLVAFGGADVQLQRVTASGTLLGGVFSASSAVETQAEPSADWNGQEFLVAWEDRRNVATFFDDRRDIYGTRVSEAGVVLDPTGLPIATSNDDEQMPAVAGRDGAALIAFGGHRPGPPHASVRTTIVRVADDACGAQAFCSTSPNSVGSGALMSHSGSLSVAANDLVLRCTDATPGVFGFFFYGSATTQVALGYGFRCVDGLVVRVALRMVDPGGVATAPIDLTSPPVPAAQITAGSTWHFQFLYRDFAAAGGGFNLSNGRSLTFCN